MKNCKTCEYAEFLHNKYICKYDKRIEQVFAKPVEKCKMYLQKNRKNILEEYVPNECFACKWVDKDYLFCEKTGEYLLHGCVCAKRFDKKDE